MKRRFEILQYPFGTGAALLLGAGWLMGCAPTVRVVTPEPIKVDVTMKVDVYQREAEGVPKQKKLGEEQAKTLRRRDNRSGEIWTMKNDGAAVETENGYLEARPRSGWDPVYVNRLVAEENKDRRMLYEEEAIESARPLSAVEADAGRRFRQQAYGAKDGKNLPADPARP